MIIEPKRARIWLPEAPHLMLRRTLHAELKQPPLFIKGFIGWELIRNGRVIAKSRLQPNLITNAGLNGIGTANTLSNITNWCGVGTDTTAPANGDTSLVAQVGGRTSSNGSIAETAGSGTDYVYWWRRKVRVFTSAEANGNLNEVGFFSASTAGIMFNRQRFKDDGGNNVTITKTSEDELRITFEWRVYPNATVTEQSVTIDGVAYDIDNRAVDIDSSVTGWNQVCTTWGTWSSIARVYEAQTLPDVQAIQSGSGTGASSIAHQAYGSGNFYKDQEATWEPAVGNFALGVGSIMWGPMGATTAFFQFISNFTPRIPKTDQKRLKLMLRAAWARHV